MDSRNMSCTVRSPLYVWLLVVVAMLSGVTLPSRPAMAQLSVFTGPEPVEHGLVRYRTGGDTPGRSDRDEADAFDVTWYDISLDLDPVRMPELRGRVVIEGRALRMLPAIRLDLARSLRVVDVQASNGSPLPFRHEDDVLWVDSVTQEGQQARIVVQWEGSPVSTGLGSWGSGYLSSRPFWWTLSEPYGARDWWPNDDHPSDKADSVRIAVRVPAPTRVGSNGVLASTTEHPDGTTTWTWEHRYPIASYLVSIAAGNYDVYEQLYQRPASLETDFGPLSLPIVHYVYAGGAAFEGVNHFSGWKRVLDVLPVLEDWYGPYPFPEEKYGHAQVTFGGGMEHQTMSSMGNIGLNLVTHELAHQWFGDQVGLTSWNDLWLNEGFATQSEILFMESDSVAYAEEYDLLFNLYYDRALQASGTLVLTDTLNESSMFSFSRVYGKGWMVLRMLRHLVGDTTYRAILREYATNRLTSTALFKQTAEQVSGMDLGRFFSDWVTTGTGAPTVDMSWVDVSTGGSYAVDVTVRQVQPADTYPTEAFVLPVDIQVQVDGMLRRFPVTITERVQTVHIELHGPPQAVTFDPERRALWRPASVDTATKMPSPRPALSVYPNPASSMVRVRSADPGLVRLVDILGRTVRSVASDGDAWISLDGLAAGVYLVDTGILRSLLTVQHP